MKKISKGFTIIELIISICLFSILLFVVVSMFFNVFSTPEKNLSALENIDKARGITSNFANEIRNASIANDGSYPLNQASNSQIIFYSNYGSSSPTIIYRIRYFVENNNLYKGVVIPSGSPLTYDLLSEEVATLLTDLENGSDPAFYYYDGDYNGSGIELSEPISLTAVKFVKINLVVPRISDENGSTFLVNAGAAVRNLKDNLGN